MCLTEGGESPFLSSSFLKRNRFWINGIYLARIVPRMNWRNRTSSERVLLDTPAAYSKRSTHNAR